MWRRWVVATVAAVLVTAGLWYLVPHPGALPSAAAAAVPAWPDPALSVAEPEGKPSPSATSTSQRAKPDHASSCRVGQPQRLRIPALGVDAPFERIGLDPAGRRDANGQLPLGTPTDRTRAGWYAAGPRPGSGTGTVLIDGHTYRNGSAIFQEDFAKRIATRQLIQLRQDNGSVCSYRIATVWREINSAHAYPQLVASQHLYNFSGPERLLLATCGGSWNATAGNYDDISVILAVPVS